MQSKSREQVRKLKQQDRGRCFLMTEVGEAEGALASCLSKHDRVAQAPDQTHRSYVDQQPTQDHHPPPLAGLCVPEGGPSDSYLR